MAVIPTQVPLPIQANLLELNKPGQIFESLLQPVKLSAHSASSRAVIELPKIGEVKAFVWRGTYFAVPASFAQAANIESVTLGKSELSEISRWLPEGVRPSSFAINRCGDSVNATSESYRIGKDLFLKTRIVFSQKEDQSPKLESLALQIELGNPDNAKVSLNYSISRNEAAEGKIQIEKPGASILIHHLDTFFIVNSNNQFNGASRRGYPSVQEVLARFLALNQDPSINSDLRATLQAVGLPRMVLAHLS